jgi:hypothetical protein
MPYVAGQLLGSWYTGEVLQSQRRCGNPRALLMKLGFAVGESIRNQKINRDL